MNILIISTSPRKKFSTSIYYSNLVRMFLRGQTVDVINLKTQKDFNEVVEKLENIDVVVFATPVYVDSIPSTTLDYLSKLEMVIRKNDYSFKVYTITNCGFYEGNQCELATNTYELWCEKSGVDFFGGIGIGAGVMIGFIRVLPLISVILMLIDILVNSTILIANGKLGIATTIIDRGFLTNFVIQTVIWTLFSLGAFCNLFRLQICIRKLKKYGKKYTTAWFCPRILFVLFGSLYWMLRATIIHGVMPWKIMKKG